MSSCAPAVYVAIREADEIAVPPTFALSLREIAKCENAGVAALLGAGSGSGLSAAQLLCQQASFVKKHCAR